MVLKRLQSVGLTIHRTILEFIRNQMHRFLPNRYSIIT